MLECSLRICGYLVIQDHFVVFMIKVLNSSALTFNKYFNALEWKMYQQAYTTHKLTLFAHDCTNQLEMLYVSFLVNLFHLMSLMLLNELRALWLWLYMLEDQPFIELWV